MHPLSLALEPKTGVITLPPDCAFTRQPPEKKPIVFRVPDEMITRTLEDLRQLDYFIVNSAKLRALFLKYYRSRGTLVLPPSQFSAKLISEKELLNKLWGIYARKRKEQLRLFLESAPRFRKALVEELKMNKTAAGVVQAATRLCVM